MKQTLNFFLPKLNLSSGQLIVLVSIFITLLNNHVLFSLLVQRLDLFSFPGAFSVVTIYLLIAGMLVWLFLALGQKYLLKPLLILFTLLAAIISYFNQELGVVFDVDMIRNVFETVRENNQQEALELVSAPLISHLLLFGVLPSILVSRVKISYKKPIHEVLSRLAYGGAIIVLVTIMATVNFKYISYFSRENRDLRVWTNPVFPTLSTYKYLAESFHSKEIPFKRLGEDARQQKPGKQRTVGILVVGETARADHFSLNGYVLDTNPLLAKEKIINFSNVTSCGTSTAFSVPCMFSFLDRDNFTPEKADRQSGVLDVLTQAGIKTVWIDNNSGCKGVCSRIESDNIHNHSDPTSQYFNEGEYYDEKLLEEMQPFIKNNQADTLIVLHIMGSHGPAYHRRYPEMFAKFKPYCEKSSPQECSDQEVSNAYDNSLLYTDFFLVQVINFLKRHTDQYESFLVYVSDHGESLGENGIYLHGFPYFLAPKAQTHIPFIAWFSDNFKKNHQTDVIALRARADKLYSHDNLSHSLLGLFQVKCKIYQSGKDIFRES